MIITKRGTSKPEIGKFAFARVASRIRRPKDGQTGNFVGSIQQALNHI